MDGVHLLNKILKIGLSILTLIFNIELSVSYAMAQDNIGSAREFYFLNKWIDIKAHDHMVPKVDYDSISDYQNLSTANHFLFGRVDEKGNLIYLETWKRDLLEEFSLEMVVAGKPLNDYEIPIIGNDIAKQKPVFFMKQNNSDDWVVVSPEKTIGESRFIRLHWAESSGHLEKTAELIQQSLESIEEYSFKNGGSSISKKVRVFEDNKIVDEFTVTGDGELIRP